MDVCKVIIEKSHGEVSLMGQDTIENVSLAIRKFKCFFLKLHILFIHQNVPQTIETFLRYYDGFIGQKILKL